MLHIDIIIMSCTLKCSMFLLRAHCLSVPDVQSGTEEDEEFEVSFPGTETKLLHNHSRRLKRIAEEINMHHISSTEKESCLVSATYVHTYVYSHCST